MSGNSDNSENDVSKVVIKLVVNQPEGSQYGDIGRDGIKRLRECGVQR